MANQKRRISGPGAADFIAAPGGEDIPGGVNSSTGSSEVQAETPLTDARNLEPDLSDDAGDVPDTEHGAPRGRDEQK
jgi:hypothetical protein